MHLIEEPSQKVEGLSAPLQFYSKDYLLRSAELLIASEDYLLARNIYSYLLKEELRNPYALKGLGICFYRLGEMLSAKKCFQAIWDLFQNEASLVWLGQCYSSDGDDSSAIEKFRKITMPGKLTGTEQFDLFKELGNCLNRSGAFDEAAKAYSQALQINPLSDVVYVNLGTLEIQRRKLELAHSYFNRAIELNPQNAKGYCGLGLVALEKSEPQSAEKEFRRALELDSQNLVAIYQLIAIANKTKRYVSVKSALMNFLAKESKNLEIHYALAVVLFKEGNWTACQNEVDTILKTDPQYSKAKELREELQSNKHSY